MSASDTDNAEKKSDSEEPEMNQMQNTMLLIAQMFDDPRALEDDKLRFIGLCVMNVVNVLILVSTIALVMESIPDYDPDLHDNWKDIWAAVEFTCVLCFTLDVVVRLICAVYTNHLQKFFTDFMNYIDILAIAPWYITKIFDGNIDLRFVRVIRLARVLRALRSGHFSHMGDVVGEIIKTSGGALMIPTYFMLLALILFSSLVYYAEEAECIETIDDECVLYKTHDGHHWTSDYFTSIPAAMWWCVVTFTTVGYGDIYPRTPLGKMIGAVTMFTGIFFIAMPLTIVGSSFSDAWDKIKVKRDRQKILELEEADGTLVDRMSLETCHLKINGHISRIRELINLSADAAPISPNQTWTVTWTTLKTSLADLEDDFQDCWTLYDVGDYTNKLD